VAVDVHPIQRDEVPSQAYASRLYTAQDIEAMVDMLKDEPVLLGDAAVPAERTARYRAGALRRLLLEYGLKVTTRTWPEITYDGLTQQVTWRWCVILKEAAEPNER
jgi:hypothetical protein